MVQASPRADGRDLRAGAVRQVLGELGGRHGRDIPRQGRRHLLRQAEGHQVPHVHTVRAEGPHGGRGPCVAFAHTY